ncbi:MAG TPA: class I SAM-dependent methyltransferase [Dissulfurispiraceae bacterium]|nr:class I SAM-dependent methyltransferase [Dissulfurispiraceae bacterium]
MSAEKRDFDKEAALWDENPGRVKAAKEIAAAIMKNIDVTADMDVLDFGCGTGLVSLRLQPFVRSIVGVDSSQGMLDVIRAKIVRMNLSNIDVRHLDTDSHELPPARFHLIVTSMTLHHVPDVQPLLVRFHAMLMPGGRLCVADLDCDEGKFHENNTGVFHYGFDRTSLRELTAAAGFEDIAFTTATEITKPAHGGATRTFPVFLMTARKKG